MAMCEFPRHMALTSVTYFSVIVFSTCVVELHHSICTVMCTQLHTVLVTVAATGCHLEMNDLGSPNSAFYKNILF